MSLQPLIRETIARRGLNIRQTQDGTRIARAATIALIPVWGRPMDDPTPENLFHQALVILAEYENSEGYEDWCEEYGFDPGGRQIRDRFDAIGKARTALVELISEERFVGLIGGLAMSQAINMARPR
ncbi:hypothetical protein V0U79_07980 [Hyphobacterium sp. HN65]|uniref:Uncharacterized protein n=1 Tax=Hyphobacterium lacteum TaxID=3116575 RepID=A0ABU7LQW2_9PROT|nr:hypothetical protein [Hyphobacterium sp. HN65]MEE2526302.1 hypothetical protein [Hyphobacterium sp. HN65]